MLIHMYINITNLSTEKSCHLCNSSCMCQHRNCNQYFVFLKNLVLRPCIIWTPVLPNHCRVFTRGTDIVFNIMGHDFLCLKLDYRRHRHVLAFILQINDLPVPFERWKSGPYSWSESFRVDKTPLSMPGIDSLFLGSPACCLVIVIITQPVLRQVHSLFHGTFYRDCQPALPFQISSIL